MRILVRHADVGGHPPTDDHGWPLTPLGRAQARRLPLRLGGLPILRILASPSLRCQQTVTPLAREIGVDVESCAGLAPGAHPGDVWRLLRDPATENAVLCADRETIMAMLSCGVDGGRRVEGVAPMPTAAAWACYGDPGRPALLRFLGAAGDLEHEPAESAGGQR
jgi:phosphohistidine phosphatase SixA